MNLGQYHTFKIDAGQKLSIMKTYWDKLHFKILNDSMKNTEQSDVKALIMDEGYFQIILELLISVSKGTTLSESSKKLRSTSLKKEMMEMTTIPKNSLSSMNSVFNIFYKLTLKKQNVWLLPVLVLLKITLKSIVWSKVIKNNTKLLNQLTFLKIY